MKITTKQVVLIGILGAILTVSQVALSFIPNIEIVSMLIILFSLIYGYKALYTVLVFNINMGFLYGFGTWIIGYCIIWPLLVVVTVLLANKLRENYLRLSIYSALFGLMFGVLYALPQVLLGGIGLAVTYWLNGIPFDLAHTVGNYFAMLLLGKILYTNLVKLNKVYFGSDCGVQPR
ncbi:MAG: hypothetical protein AB9856_15915 [Cellulosilyticaceae bacterium]